MSVVGGDERVELVRLTEVAVADVHAVLSDPRIRRHMPLAGDTTLDAAAEWIVAKDALWQQVGYGPWAVLVDGTVVGWGGFQPEDVGPDLALVLTPPAWGLGTAIARRMIARGFTEFGFDEVFIALPLSRDVDSVRRWGFEPVADTEHAGVRFRQFRLTRRAWTSL